MQQPRDLHVISQEDIECYRLLLPRYRGIDATYSAVITLNYKIKQPHKWAINQRSIILRVIVIVLQSNFSDVTFKNNRDSLLYAAIITVR